MRVIVYLLIGSLVAAAAGWFTGISWLVSGGAAASAIVLLIAVTVAQWKNGHGEFGESEIGEESYGQPPPIAPVAAEQELRRKDRGVVRGDR